MPTIAEQLTQLESDRQDLVDNLETKGITGLSGDETFTELVPEVLNIPSGGGDIPSEYQQLLYLETTSRNKNSNYIDLNLYPNQDTEIELLFSSSEYSKSFMSYYDRLFGAESNLFSLEKSGQNNDNVSLNYSNTNYSFSLYGTKYINTPITIKLNKEGIYRDDTLITSISANDFQCSNTLYLFSNNGGQYADKDGKWILYYCKIRQNNVLIRDLLPVMRIADNKKGLYDITNKVFYPLLGSAV